MLVSIILPMTFSVNPPHSSTLSTPNNSMRRSDWKNMQPLLERQKQSAYHHNGCIADQSIIIPYLSFFLQPEFMLGDLKKHLNIPAVTVRLHDFLRTHSCSGGENRQPNPFLPIVTKKIVAGRPLAKPRLHLQLLPPPFTLH